jgi:hypothetical protein
VQLKCWKGKGRKTSGVRDVGNKEHKTWEMKNKNGERRHSENSDIITLWSTWPVGSSKITAIFTEILISY